MDFWTAIVIIVIVGTVGETLRHRNKYKTPKDAVTPEQFAALEQKIASQGERIKNLETILFDMERENAYRDLEK